MSVWIRSAVAGALALAIVLGPFAFRASLVSGRPCATTSAASCCGPERPSDCEKAPCCRIGRPAPKAAISAIPGVVADLLLSDVAATEAVPAAAQGPTRAGRVEARARSAPLFLLHATFLI